MSAETYGGRWFPAVRRGFSADLTLTSEIFPDGLAGVAHVGLTTDGAAKVYFSANGSVYRYTPADGRVVLVSSGFLFADAHINTLTLDGFGNLWIGDDPTEFNFSGRLWRIPASRLATVL